MRPLCPAITLISNSGTPELHHLTALGKKGIETALSAGGIVPRKDSIGVKRR